MSVGPLATNCYIVSDENTKQAVIIDPGAQPEKIAGKVAELGLHVEAILLTHGHFDHMMAVDNLREKYQVSVYLGTEDAQVISSPEGNVSAMFGRPVATKADVLVKDGEELTLAGFSIHVLLTPGHTPGGVCYYFKEQEAAFSGDTIFEGSVGRTDFPGGSSSALTASIKKKLFVLPDDTQLFPGHGDSTTVGYEKQYNMFV